VIGEPSRLYYRLEAERKVMNTNQITAPAADWEIVAVAVILIVTGFFLLGGDVVGILSLDRIQNLWPLALIAAGVTDLFSRSGSPKQTY
jgi:hypothetical protein